mmetsp:Transcript_23203/g.64096  ORF Transcript_23203/g.64096 Transcript_23203/m.64096 type:complete len:242 (-) Transcript_23203:138-863(-)
MPHNWKTSWPLGELEYLVHNLEASGHLPQEKSQIGNVEQDVCVPCSLVALLHGRHQGCRNCPQRHDGSTSVQVRSGEQLPSPHECVGAALNGNASAPSQQQRAQKSVLVLGVTSQQRLALLLLLLNCWIWGSRRICCPSRLGLPQFPNLLPKLPSCAPVVAQYRSVEHDSQEGEVQGWMHECSCATFQDAILATRCCSRLNIQQQRRGCSGGGEQEGLDGGGGHWRLHGLLLLLLLLLGTG